MADDDTVLDDDGQIYERQHDFQPFASGWYEPTGKYSNDFESPKRQSNEYGPDGQALYNRQSDSCTTVDSSYPTISVYQPSGSEPVPVDLSPLGPVFIWLLKAAAVIVGLLLVITISPIISAIVFKTAIKDFNKHSSDTSNKKADWPFLYWIGWLMLVTSVLPLSALGVLIGFWLFGWLVSLYPFYELPVLESIYELAMILPAVLIGPAILVVGLLPAWTTKNKAGIMHKQAMAFFETADKNSTPSSQSAG